MRHTFLLAILALWLLPSSASAQYYPYYNRDVMLYEPVIDVVTSGVQMTATPVVSADRKYVTITAQPQLSQLIRLQNFAVATGFGGFVGGYLPPQPQPQPQLTGRRPTSPANPPAAARSRPGILSQPGMTRIAP